MLGRQITHGEFDKFKNWMNPISFIEIIIINYTSPFSSSVLFNTCSNFFFFFSFSFSLLSSHFTQFFINELPYKITHWWYFDKKRNTRFPIFFYINTDMKNIGPNNIKKIYQNKHAISISLLPTQKKKITSNKCKNWRNRNWKRNKKLKTNRTSATICRQWRRILNNCW